MKRIGVISDTHMREVQTRIPQGLREAWGALDLILHAGDITSPGLLSALNKLADTHAVAGNMDGATILALAPRQKLLRIEGCQIALLHGAKIASALGRDADSSRFHRALQAQFPTASCIVYGHTHQATCVRERDILFLNPGSCSWRGDELVGSVALLTIDGASAAATLVRF